ncbi:MAG: cadherin-like beta sandwich domain-containing protein [Bacilli bacterium]|nr:cadherin-like beta sandwich domain-containing protein [Bacilli bacterium]
MKKGLKYIFMLLILGIPFQVKASVSLSQDGFTVWETDSKNLYIASGKQYVLDIEASGTKITWEDQVLTDEKPSKIVVNLSTSSNISCNLAATGSDYTLNSNTFNLSNLDFNSGKIGTITCNIPTTDTIIQASSASYINIDIAYAEKDYVQDTPETNGSAHYKYKVGVINQSYINSLKTDSSITSVTFDGTPLQEMRTLDTNKGSTKLNINTSHNKNKIVVNVIDKDENLISSNEWKASEQTISLTYGTNYIELNEYPENYVVLHDLIWGEDTEEYGFTDGSFNMMSSSKYYLLNRQDTRSKDNTLKSLKLSDVAITFKKDQKTYTAKVPYKVSSTTISATTSDKNASFVEGYGNRTVKLNPGENEVLIKVKAQNGAEATYTVKITREENNDATLKILSINGNEIALKKDVYKYSTVVNNKQAKVDIKATPNDEKAKITVDGPKELKEGKNKITITVEAADGTKLIYTLEVKRDGEISTNAKIKKIEIEGYDLYFSPEQFSYRLKVNKNTKELEMKITPDYAKTKYTVEGNKKLKDGSIIKVKTTAEDGKTTRTYTIEIEKESSPFISILITIGIISVLLGLGVFFFMKKGKKETEPKPVEEKTKEEPPKEVSVEETPKKEEPVEEEVTEEIKEESPIEEKPPIEEETVPETEPETEQIPSTPEPEEIEEKEPEIKEW